MRILLARPAPDMETMGLQHIMLVEPLELEVLAATVQPPHTCTIVDMTLEDRPFRDILLREQPDILGVTGYITNVPGMIALCRTAKQIRPSIRTVAGGVHCEVVPADLDSEWIDYRVVRNAASVFPQLVAHTCGQTGLPQCVLEPGQPAPAMPPERDFRFPRPRRDLTRRYRNRYFYVFHKHVALMKTSFGCPHDCNFCFCRNITGGIYRQRPLDDVMGELAGLEQTEVYIVDDDFLADRARVEAFISACRAMAIAKHYLIYGRADFIASNPGIIARFRDVGLRTVIVGLESFVDSELASYNKRSDASANAEALRVLQRLGVDCYATIILPPDWGHGQFRELRDKLRAHGVRYVNLQPLTPLPGTACRPAREQIVSAVEFTKWDLAHVMFRPDHMSVSEYYREIVATYDAVLFKPSVLAEHLRRYRVTEVVQMALATMKVRSQYRRRIRESSSG